MRKIVVTVMASLLSCSSAFAFWPEALDSSLEVGVGYRRDKLNWKTEVNCDDSYCDNERIPFGLGSEVKWKNLNIWQIEARGKYVTCDNIYLRANGDYGWISSGKSTDTDFASIGDGYYNEDCDVAQSHSKAKGHVYDAEIALGYQFKMCDDSFAIAPLIGYSWNGQCIEDRHLRHHDYFESYDCSYYEYDKKHGKYHAKWNGPFIGFDFDYRFGCGCQADWEIFGGYEFHWAQYHANADWQKRTDLCDGFRHHAKKAWGHNFDLGIKWDFCECWTLGIKGEFKWWCAHHGHDRARIAETSFCDAEVDCFLKIPLKDVKWQSAGVSIDVGMVF